MPPPKRPFTTSSLTSSLKSTFANQPLLNNLTNIDKLSSQASSLAQKTPFFGAINQQFQQHYQHQQQDSQNQQDAGQARPSQSQANVTSGAVSGISSSVSGSGDNSQSGTSASRSNADMFRNVQTTNQGRVPAPQVPAAAGTPAVDMSHLTEEERAMIQSVMAKAEMADMGLPIDTSMPSSTNLPSNTSQALTRQRDQQQKQQQLEQHRKQQMHSAGPTSNDQNQQQQLNSSQQNQHPPCQSQSIQQQQLTQDKQEFNIKMQYQQQQQQQEMASQMGQSFRQNEPLTAMTQQQLQQQQQQQQGLDQSHTSEMAGQSNVYAQQFAANQALIDTELASNQTMNNYYRQDINQNMIVNNENLGYAERVKAQQAQTMDQQSIMQTTGALNSGQNNLDRSMQQIQNSGALNLQQQQPHQQRLITSDVNQLAQEQMITQYAPTSTQIGINQAQQLTGVPLMQGQQYNFQDSLIQAQHLTQSEIQAQPQSMPQTRVNQMSALTGNLELIQPLPSSVNQLDRPYESRNLTLNTTNFMNSPNLDGQLPQTNAITQFQVDTNLFVQNPIFEQTGQQYVKPMIVKTRIRPRSTIETSSDFEHEHAFSDLDDQRAMNRKRSARSNQPVSRHESVDTDRRSSKRSRDRCLTRDMQAYDLANQRLESRVEQKSRKLPQPGSNQGKPNPKDRSLQSPGEYFPEYRQKSREDKTHSKRTDFPQKPPPARPKSASRRGTRGQQYQTETDPEYDSQSGTDSTERCTRPKEIVAAKNPPVSKETTVEETTEKRDNPKDDLENENALELLKNLKLTEHANQVMQQQQLLIKQSQELIKLQQAQLEQQTEAKKNGGDRQAKSQPEESSAPGSIAEKELIADKRSDDETSSTIRSILGENANESEKIITRQNSARKETKDAVTSPKVRRDESDLEDSVKPNRENLNEPDHIKKSDKNRLHQNHSSNSSRLSTNHRRERDILQSPTDTTDSDSELVSRSSSCLRQQKHSNRQGAAQKVRREPQGLPPSPLPVAAAIQLHQMQQRHKNQLATSNISRANYLRSRSVTSSPNHMLDRLVGSGYMTDDQKRRPTSPDTLSEYGGFRRRKRLPNPPQNVLPITPSIVRRLHQVNKMATSGTSISATAANSRPTTNSSALSTRLTRNTSLTTRFPPSSINQSVAYNFDRVNSPSSGRHISGTLSGTGISSRYPIGFNHQVPSTNSSTLSRDFDRVSSATNLTRISPRSHPSSSLNYYDSMIGESEINDIKETPELDKLISNLDAYYNLEGATASKLNQQQYTPATRPINSAHSHLDNSHLPPITRSPDTRPSTITYGSPRSFQAQSYSNLNTTTEAIHMGSNRSRIDVDDYPSVYTSTLTGHDYTTGQQQARTSNYPVSSYYVPSTSSPSSSRQQNLGSNQIGCSDAPSAFKRYPSLKTTNHNWQSIDQPTCVRDPYLTNFTPPGHMASSRRYSYDSAPNDLNYNTRAPQLELIQPNEVSYNRAVYTDNTQRRYESEFRDSNRRTDREYLSGNPPANQFGGPTNSVTPLTKADIINNGPKFDSIGYRFRTESLNKYVADQRLPVECLQSKYLYPYKRILLSKNPKDRIGNGIGVKIVGGQSLPSLYDKVNKCVVTSGAFVTEVFQSSRVYFMDEMHEGDQIIEWNGVNLCNRSDEEVQQILYSQFSDDEVEIIYLNRDKFFEAYDVGHERAQLFTTDGQRGGSYEINDTFDVFSRLNKTSAGSKKSRTLGLERSGFFMNSR